MDTKANASTGINALPSERKKITPHARDEYHFSSPDHLLELSYLELEERNLAIKKDRLMGRSSDEMKTKLMKYLEDEKGIKAITVFFSDIEGRLHALDYDKKHLLDSEDNLTFDGSSIRGFTRQKESDLRLKIDWTSFRFAPPDLFGSGKILVFGNVCDKDGSPYDGDFRSKLAGFMQELRQKKGVTVNMAPEIEGFLFKGQKAEQTFDEKKGFSLETMSGYFSSLPQESLRLFIDKFAEVQRALGFQNEKDHPEVAPAQFELNFRYSDALDAADQIQLYKLLARQVASSMGMTASFLPKPIQNLNGNGMHTNISLSKDGKNIFHEEKGEHHLSETAHKFLTGILYHAESLCVIMNSSVNSYRRLDPAFEAPNEIKVSSVDRGSMIRVPIGNEKSARIEVRTVAPDANPYLCMYALLKAGYAGLNADAAEYQKMKETINSEKTKKLPSDIDTALKLFTSSNFIEKILGAENTKKYASLKTAAANRSPRNLGNRVKSGEILYHHEVTNQLLWADF